MLFLQIYGCIDSEALTHHLPSWEEKVVFKKQISVCALKEMPKADNEHYLLCYTLAECQGSPTSPSSGHRPETPSAE